MFHFRRWSRRIFKEWKNQVGQSVPREKSRGPPLVNAPPSTGDRGELLLLCPSCSHGSWHIVGAQQTFAWMNELCLMMLLKVITQMMAIKWLSRLLTFEL